MHWTSLAASCLLASSAVAKRPLEHVRKANRGPEKRADVPLPHHDAWGSPGWGWHHGQHNKTIIPQTKNTTKFAVDGKAIPEVDFDIGESYAGVLPISEEKDASELYFWFFPSANELAGDEILIWLNGGPGCSSLEGNHGPRQGLISLDSTYKPVPNPYTWVNLTNVVWVEQPAGTGFSKKHGTPSATDELEVAEQFLGFWKNFVDTFELHGRKVYVTGESYAGAYVPYIADAMHNKTDDTYYNVDSILIYDPTISYGVVQDDIPAVPFVDYWQGLFSLNETFTADIHTRADECGYTDFMNTAMQFPPKGPLPTPPNVNGDVEGCSIWQDIYNAALVFNPCWDVYQVATTCPILWDVLGFPGSIGYLPDGATIYFNRTDVQKAINAPIGEWEECSNGVLDTDNSPPSSLSVLPRVIEKNTRTVRYINVWLGLSG
nr:putative serine carboxypeptidase [Quercus suber]